jgi:hypothetical protein
MGNYWNHDGSKNKPRENGIIVSDSQCAKVDYGWCQVHLQYKSETTGMCKGCAEDFFAEVD